MDKKNGGRGFTEEIVVAGNELVEFVKRAVKEGNVRRLILRNSDDQVMLEIPLATGAVVSGALVLVTPVIAALGALAALLAQVKVTIERDGDGDGDDDGEPKDGP